MNPEDWTDKLSRNVGKQLATNASSILQDQRPQMHRVGRQKFRIKFQFNGLAWNSEKKTPQVAFYSNGHCSEITQTVETGKDMESDLHQRSTCNSDFVPSDFHIFGLLEKT
jgi:hypothetical protein